MSGAIRGHQVMIKAFASLRKAAKVKRATSIGRGAMFPPIHELRHEWFEMSTKVSFSNLEVYWCAMLP
jgi:hypothetical protein